MSDPLQPSLTAPHSYLKSSSITFSPLSLFFSGLFPCVLDKSSLLNSHAQSHPLYPSLMNSNLNWDWSQVQIFSFSIESLLKTFTLVLLSPLCKWIKTTETQKTFCNLMCSSSLLIFAFFHSFSILKRVRYILYLFFLTSYYLFWNSEKYVFSSHHS